MSDAFLQDVCAGTAVDGKVHFDLGNVDKAKALSDIHQIDIADAFLCLLAGGKGSLQLLVVFLHGFLCRINVLLIHLGNRFLIGIDGTAGIGLCNQVADKGVQCDAESGQKERSDIPHSKFAHGSSYSLISKCRLTYGFVFSFSFFLDTKNRMTAATIIETPTNTKMAEPIPPVVGRVKPLLFRISVAITPFVPVLLY